MLPEIHPTAPRGSQGNLIQLWHQTKDWERKDGFLYYDRQRERLTLLAKEYKRQTAAVIAAFCALSPNNAESTNYTALRTCLDILAGRLPGTARVIAYTANKTKALAILRGAKIEEVLRGRKVYSFFRNTIDPDDGRFITVDGHMLGAWCNRRFILRREAEISKGEYYLICEHFREAAQCLHIPAPRLQSTLWMAWKRINKILYNPQMSLQLEEYMSPPLNGSHAKDGQSTAKGTSYTPAEKRTA